MSDYLSTMEYAARVGVTDQTVRNWCDARVIPAQRDERERWRISPVEADAALSRNRRASGRGGPRRGAGRKRDDDRRDGLGYGVAEFSRAVAARDEAPAGAVHIGELLKCTRDELTRMLAIGERIGLGQAQFDLLKVWESIRKLALENDEKEGRLVRADDMERTIRDALAFVRLNLEKIPAAAAEAVDIWLPADRSAQILDLLRSADVDADVVSAVAALLERPQGLDNRVRAAVQAEVDRACAAIVQWKS